MRHSRATALGLAAAAAAALVLSACSPAAQAPPAAADTSKDVAAIRSGEELWNEAFKARALEPLVGHYSHDAVLMAPGVAPARGQDAIRAMLIDMLADPKFALSFAPDKVVVAASGDLAYTSGTYSQTTTDPKTHAVAHETGTYVTVYHKASEGSWKAVADINTPSPASP